MTAWLCIPSIRPLAELEPVLEQWCAQGYKIALLRQGPEPSMELVDFYQATDHYRGWATSINHLARLVIGMDHDAEWIVTGGDDTLPDLAHKADEIAAQCTEHFGGTFGVCQPTGHRWGSEEPWAKAMFPGREAYIDRIAGSPWLGRSYCERVNQGKGPLWPEYRHCWADEEAQCVAEKLGVFWQRRDLIHLHNHAALKGGAQPPHMTEVNKTYQQDKPLFDNRKAHGFPGHEPL